MALGLPAMKWNVQSHSTMQQTTLHNVRVFLDLRSYDRFFNMLEKFYHKLPDYI
ncbi:7953_t:CDS:2 [Paraglomus brasilianum]|uniref:7953_t:CDS:1 n=1 Tax=Paraglomus brasilianum TaxID=144538 RepID=A0A9N9BAK8_9GLOM|nr:7953_t:CDS:2 [Paraglomus brasilianum]